jgi:hypothetical protein
MNRPAPSDLVGKVQGILSLLITGKEQAAPANLRHFFLTQEMNRQRVLVAFDAYEFHLYRITIFGTTRRCPPSDGAVRVPSAIFPNTLL